MTTPLHIKNAHVWDGSTTTQRDLYTANGRIVEQSANGAHVVDLDGYTIFPGLINAHDHLELNHYPRSKFRDVYDNAHQWGEDMNARLDSEPYQSLRAYPLKDRLFIGGLKNLLCGATTVAHHGPPHKPMFASDFPVRVLKNYGWAHSLHFSTEEEIVDSYRKTPQDWPWFIHLAEGTDDVAASEYQRLKALGCVGPNTVIVHGVGMTEEDIADAAPRIRGLVWCISTNRYLLDAVPEDKIKRWLDIGGKVFMGSDSRLTTDSDLKFEILLADFLGFFSVPDFTLRPAHAFGLVRSGHLQSDAWADWYVGKSTRDPEFRDRFAAIVKSGIPRIGNPDIMAKFSQVQTVAATLDGVPKAIHIDLARRIHQCSLKESGLDVDALPGKRYFLF